MCKFLFRWFKLLKRKSKGHQIQAEYTIGFDILDKLDSNFAEYCIMNEIILSHNALRLKLKNLYFPRVARRTAPKVSSKRKRSSTPDNNVEENEINLNSQNEINVFGFNPGNFSKLKTQTKRLRTAKRGKYLTFHEQNSVTQFFLHYNDKFRNDSKNFKCIKAILCRMIDEDFNILYGNHGLPGKGTGFIFEVEYPNGSQEELHYCLSSGCQYGCKKSSFKMK